MNWFFIVLTAFVIFLTGCEEGAGQSLDGPVTIQQYNQLENRMEFDDVIEMLGQPDLINFKEHNEEEVEYIDANTNVQLGRCSTKFRDNSKIQRRQAFQ